MNRSLGIGLMGVMLGMITAPLDGMMLGPALPTIVGDLGGLEYFSWVATAYLICMAAATPIWGKLGDLYGRKPVDRSCGSLAESGWWSRPTSSPSTWSSCRAPRRSAAAC